MCTVSWLRQAEGYVLLCNRDERHTRKAASGPRIGSVHGVLFVAPVDGDQGGSWIGTNQFGLTLCLLNRYGDWMPDPNSDYTSRGLLLVDLLDCRDNQHLSERVNHIELDRFQPFTMLALSVDEPATLIDWNGLECAVQLDAELRMPLTSSSLKDTNVNALRRKVFAELGSHRGSIDSDLLHQFHQSHLPNRGPHSVCMHRDDAATISLSIVTVGPASVEFLYHPKSPCLKATEEKVSLKRTTGRSQPVPVGSA
ncbi:MAG TPA: NRDE family protein [Pyrinomonadaceae bacterium]|nr:NRDE family protein [Pyrinomonadaceae bacterium]